MSTDANGVKTVSYPTIPSEFLYVAQDREQVQVKVNEQIAVCGVANVDCSASVSTVVYPSLSSSHYTSNVSTAPGGTGTLIQGSMAGGTLVYLTGVFNEKTPDGKWKYINWVSLGKAGPKFEILAQTETAITARSPAYAKSTAASTHEIFVWVSDERIGKIVFVDQRCSGPGQKCQIQYRWENTPFFYEFLSATVVGSLANPGNVPGIRTSARYRADLRVTPSATA